MLGRKPSRRRRGVHLVECALVFPIFMTLVVGMVVLGMAVFRYQQVAYLAREGARWASVRGAQYQRELNPYGKAGLPLAATAADIRDHVISRSTALRTSPDLLDVAVSWDTSNEPFHVLKDSNGLPKLDANGSVIRVGNTVSVTVSYRWTAEAGSFRPITLTSTSRVPMSY
jgi:Flp pilus assembly protein TadG